MCIRVNYLRGLRHRDYLPLLAQPTHTRRIVALVQIFQFDIFQSLVLSRRYDDTHFSFCDILPRRIAVKRHSMSNRANGTFVQREREGESGYKAQTISRIGDLRFNPRRRVQILPTEYSILAERIADSHRLPAGLLSHFAGSKHRAKLLLSNRFGSIR